MDMVFDDGGTPRIDAAPLARANLVWVPEAKKELLDRDWRADPLAYEVPEDLRLPTTHPPTSCTEALCRRIEQLVITGVSVRAAKTTCGVSRDNWRQWEGYAKQDKQPYWQMMERMRLAMAFREATLIRTVGAAAEHPDPGVALKATDKLLGVTNPAKYAPKTVPTSSNSVTNNVQVNVNGLDALRTMGPEQIRALGELFAGKTAPDPVTSDRWLAVPTADED